MAWSARSGPSLLIAALHRDWGEAQGNYDELRFFTGLRPSEEIALVVTDYDRQHGVLGVTKARVGGIDKDCTKTGQDRRIVLCPRAIAVVERQLRLRACLVRAGIVQHQHLFFTEEGGPIPDVKYPYGRWQRTLAPRDSLPQTVCRPPYLGQLESDAGSQSTVSRQRTWSPHHHDVDRVCRLG